MFNHLEEYKLSPQKVTVKCLHKGILLAFSVLFIVLIISSFSYAAGWIYRPIDSNGTETSIALDSADRPHVSYCESQMYLKYASWEAVSGKWLVQTVDSDYQTGFSTDIALDSANRPHISYYRETNGALKYASWEAVSGTWVIQTVDAVSTVRSTSIALDSANRPHISYYDMGNFDLKYASWESGSGTWVIQTVDSTGEVGAFNSIALDSSGRPHISYNSDIPHNLKYASWEAVSEKWVIQTVEAWGNEGTYTSLALDSSDRPHISYKGEGTLKYASWEAGSGWVIQTVDSNGNAGAQTSIALDSSGRPHISYGDTTDIAHIRLKYASWESISGTWEIQTLDPITMAQTSSLALDSTDKPHIVYYEALNNIPKYAAWSENPVGLYITVEAPNTNITITGGTTFEIQWSVTSEYSIKTNGIKLSYTPNSGITWFLITPEAPNTGTYIWNVPRISATQCRISIEALDRYGNYGSDISNVDFIISAEARVTNNNLGLRYATIQDALNDAGAGHLLTAEAGIFNEHNIIWPNKNNITLRGAGMYDTIISAEALSRAVNVTSPVQLTIESMTIRDGKNNGGNGGGINLVSNSTLHLKNILFRNNRTLNVGPQGNGGAVGSEGVTVYADGCIFKKNHADGWGGVGFKGNWDVKNSIFVENDAGGGGVVGEGSSFYGSWNAANCVFYGNSAINGGITFGINFKGENLIAWNTTGTPFQNTNATIEYSDLQTFITGEGNISSVPFFISTSEGSDFFKLAAGSPCIDTASAEAPPLDLAGNHRPFGLGNDMGAVEFLGPSVKLIQPDGGQVIFLGTSYDIQWEVSPEVDHVRIRLSTNEGASWGFLLTDEAWPHSGTCAYSWTPEENQLSINCMVSVEARYNGIWNCDRSGSKFTLTRAVLVIQPNGGERIITGTPYNIVWEVTPEASEIYIRLSTNEGESWGSLITHEVWLHSDTCTFSWTPSSDSVSTKCLISVEAKQEGIWKFDTSDTTFEIFPATFDLSVNTTSGAFYAASSSVTVEPAFYYIVISNEGTMTNSFDLSAVNSGASWKATFHLMDNAWRVPSQDAITSIEAVASGVSKEVFIIVTPPVACPAGSINTTEVTITSKFDPGIKAVATFETRIGISTMRNIDPRQAGLSPYKDLPHGVLQWKYNTGGAIQYSKPAIASDGTIYVGSNNAIWAFNPNGTVKWYRTPGAYTSPAIGKDGTVYVAGANGNFYAINPDGTQKWVISSVYAYYSSPVIGQDGTIYVGGYSNNRLYAINPGGTVKWYVSLNGPGEFTPAIGYDGIIYMSDLSGYFYAVRPDGTVKWSQNLNATTGPTIAPDGWIYIGQGNYIASYNPNGSYISIGYLGSQSRSNPAIGPDGTVYVAREAGDLYAFDKHLPSSSPKWTFTTGTVYNNSPIVGYDGTIYQSSYDYKMYAINPNGTLKWAFTTEGQNSSTPALGPYLTLYFGSGDQYLYCLGGDNTIPSVEVVSPGAAFITLEAGITYEVSWYATDETGFPGGNYISIYYATQEGNWIRITSSEVNNRTATTGAYTWKVPDNIAPVNGSSSGWISIEAKDSSNNKAYTLSSRFSFAGLLSHVYVSTGGSDTYPTGDGSAGKPYRTVRKGLNRVSIGGSIEAAAGIYLEHDIQWPGRNNVTLHGSGSNETIISAEALGRIITVESAVNLTIEALTFKDGYENNQNGGGIFLPAGVFLKLKNVNITGNRSTGSSFGGGAIYTPGNHASTICAESCTFNNNSAYNGGVSVNIDWIVSRCTFRDNSALGMAGVGLYGTWNVTDCAFYNNSANASGVFQIDFSNELNIDRSTFSNNHVISSGSVVGGGILNINNSNFYNNDTSAGGMFCSNGGDIVNCTFYGNHDVSGNGSIVYGNGGYKFKNCILWGNDSPLFYGTDGEIEYCDIQNGAWGPLTNVTGNISSEPVFITTEAGNPQFLRLSRTSPCIDTGTFETGVPTTDAAGNTRPHGFNADMGAYEFMGPSISIESPNGGETLHIGSYWPIKWLLAGEITGNVNIRLSTNEGFSWDIPIASVSSSQGPNTYMWTNIPDFASNECLISIDATGNGIWNCDTSSGTFEMKTFTDLVPPVVTMESPSGFTTLEAGVPYSVTWLATDETGFPPVNYVSVYYATIEGNWITASSVESNNTATSGAYSWKVPDDIAPVDGFSTGWISIEVRDMANNQAFALSPLLSFAGLLSWVHVSTGGSDTYPAGDGSMIKPYRTVQKGLYRVAMGCSVEAAAGTYAEISIHWPKRNNITLMPSPETAICTIDAQGGTCISLESAVSLTIEGFTLRYGVSPYNGGGMFLPSGSTIHLKAVTIRNCGGTTYSGGAIYSEDNSVKIFAQDCLFKNNNAYLGGVAYKGTWYASGCAIEGNFASIRGGVADSADWTAINCTINSNESYFYGGVAYEGKWNVTNCSFNGNGNKNYTRGGILYGGSLEAINSIFSNNKGGYGGVAFLGDLTATNCTFEANASPFGGVAYNGDTWYGLYNITNCFFRNNGDYKSNGYGGVSVGGTWNVKNSVFTGNYACNGGVGYHGNWNVENSIFNNNIVSYEGGVFTDTDIVKATNCTFYGNIAPINGEVAGFTTIFEAKNCIFWGGNKQFSSFPASLGYCDIQSKESSSLLTLYKCIEKDPMFISTVEPYNFHMDANSSCLDNGTNESGVPSKDAEGISRPQGYGVDMGAYEQAGAGISLITVIQPNGGEKLIALTPYTVTWQISGFVTTDVYVKLSTNEGATWDTLITREPGVLCKHTYVWTPSNDNASKKCIVSVEAGGPGGWGHDTSNATFEIKGKVITKEVWVSWDTGSDEAGDGTSGNPYKTISYALTNIATGGAVYAFGGTYYENNISWSPFNNITLNPSSETSVCTIDAQRLGRVISVESAVNLTIESFTIQNGRASMENGGGILLPGGSNLRLEKVVIQYCSVEAPENARYGGAVFAADNSVGVSAQNCRFAHNVSPRGGVAANGIWHVKDCTFEANSANLKISNNPYGWGGVANGGTWTATNCAFSNNSANAYGGVFNESDWKVLNCSFNNNTSGYSGGVRSEGTLEAVDSVFINNSAQHAGGVSLGGYHPFTAIGCTFEGNTSGGGGYGGGVEYTGTLKASNCLFRNNGAIGGASYAFAGVGGFRCEINNCIFIGNYARGNTNSKGGVWHTALMINMKNSIFIGNTSSGEGGIAWGSLITAENCTFYNNTAVGSGDVATGGEGEGYESRWNAKNCIFWGSNDQFNKTSGTLEYCNVQNEDWSSFNRVFKCISKDPLFVSTTAPYDLHMNANSPCIDTGITIEGITRDAEGISRPLGAGYDIGAYEQSGLGLPVIRVLKPNGGESLMAGVSYEVKWQISGVVTSDVYVRLSTNEGASWDKLITQEPAVICETTRWWKPTASMVSTECLISVEAGGPGGWDHDTSNATFEIVAPVDHPPLVTVEAPNGGESIKGGDKFNVRWKAMDDYTTSESLTIRIYYSSSESWQYITTTKESASGIGTYEWTTPSTWSSTEVKVRISATDESSNIATDESNAKFTIDSFAPLITVITPDAGITLEGTKNFTVKWIATEEVRLTAEAFTIWLKRGTAAWEQIVTKISSLDTTYLWSVTGTDEPACYISMEALDTVGHSSMDASGPFSIMTRPTAITNLAATSLGTREIRLTWTATWDNVPSQSVASYEGYLSTEAITAGNFGNLPQNKFTIGPPKAPNLTEVATISGLAANKTYYFAIRSRDGYFNWSDISNVASAETRDIYPPVVAVIAPTTGEVIKGGNKYNITWTAIDNITLPENLTIRLYYTSSEVWTSIDTTKESNAGLGTYEWLAPSNWSSKEARIRVTATDELNNLGTCESYKFSIDSIAPVITITSPDAGLTIEANSPFNIKWIATDEVQLSPEAFTIWYSTSDGSSWINIASGRSSLETSYNSWTAPNMSTTEARISMEAKDRAGHSGYALSGKFRIRLISAAGKYVSKTGLDSNDGSQSTPYRTIARGLSAVGAGETVYVFGSTEAYNEWNLPWPNRNNVTLKKLDGETLPVTIDAGAVSGQRCITVDAVSTNVTNMTIEGITLQKGWVNGANGGGLYLNKSGINVWLNNVTIQNCTVEGSAIRGGAVSAKDNLVRIFARNCAFNNNIAASDGGGFAVYGSWTVSGCAFVNNSALIGGVFREIIGTMEGCVFTGNRSTYASLGGGVDYNSTCFASNCTFESNSAVSNGGVAYLGTWNVKNSIFNGNSATTGNGGVANSSNWTATNCAFCNNTAANGGVAWGGTWNPTNSIFWANSATTAGPVFNSMAAGGKLRCCDVQNNNWANLATPECISADPRFVSTTPGAEDLHLMAGSPCIDTGTKEPGVPALDADGKSRPRGLGVDMGPYEFQGPSISVLSPNGGESLSAGENFTITWKTSDEVLLYSKPITIKYSADGGSSWTLITKEVENTGIYTWEAPQAGTSNGLISIEAVNSLWVWNCDTSNSTFEIVAPIIWVSTTGHDDTGEGTVTNPYGTIAKGLSMVKPGKKVYAFGGTYNEWNLPWPNKDNITLKASMETTPVTIDAGAVSEQRCITVDAVSNVTNLTIEGITLQKGRVSSANGGGLYLNKSGIKVWLNNVTIQDCSAEGTRYGGAVSAPDITVKIFAQNCLFSNNRASYGGGVSYKASWAATGCIFKNNSQTNNPNDSNSSYSGGVASQGSWEVSSCTFEANTAYKGGVASYGNWTVNSCAFKNNVALNNGGVFTSHYGGRPIQDLWNVTDSIFENNSAGNAGGVDQWSKWNVTRSVFKNNSALAGGVFASLVVTLESCTLNGNRATAGQGGVAIGAGTWNVTNCTFYDNDATGAGDVAYNYTCNIRNSIFWGSPSPFNTMYGTIKYSDVQNGIWGGLTQTNCISAEPRFLSTAQADANFLRLGYGSPCIDSGTLETGIPTKDAAGYSIPRGFMADMGAYEFQGPSIFVLSPNGGESFPSGDNITITWKTSDEGLLASTPITIKYSANGGSTWTLITKEVADTGIYTWEAPQAGTTSGLISIEVVNLSGGWNCDTSNSFFKIISPVIWVSPEGHDDTGDGTQSNAYQTISKGLSRVIAPGQIVRLFGGTYSGPGNYDIPWPNMNNITLRAYDLNSPVIIDAGGTVGNRCRCITIESVSNAKNLTIEGITLQGAYTKIDNNGGAIFVNQGNKNIWLKYVTIKNCTVDSNQYNGAYSGGGIYAADNSVTIDAQYCTFKDNRVVNTQSNSKGSGGVAGNGTWIVNYCTFEGNNASFNGGVAFNGKWKVSNSTFKNNIAAGQGGVAYGGYWDVTKSIFTTNVCSESGYGGGVASYNYWNVTTCEFTNNSAVHGAVFNPFIVTAEGCTFNGNRATGGYGGVANGGTLFIRNCTFEGNSALSGGGVANGSTWKVFDSTFNNNKGYGGGVACGTYTWTVTRCAFTNNNTGNTSNDAGVASGGTWNAYECIFSNNRSTKTYGGAFGGSGGVSNGTTWTLNYCTFEGNSAERDSGVFAGGTWTANYCLFINNHSNNAGGVARGSTSYVTYSDFRNNSSEANHGGVLFQGTYTVTKCAFVGNSAALDGGVAWGITMTASDCVFVSNEAKNNGGVDSSGVWTVNRCTFESNRASVQGGVCSGGGPWLVINSTFNNNSAPNGGIAWYNSWTATNCAFNNNNADYGGVLYTWAWPITWNVSNCAFTNNRASVEGGVVYNLGIGQDARNTWNANDCTFSNNSAKFGGVLLNKGSGGSSIWNAFRCSFESNTASAEGGVAYNSETITWNVTECAFSNNSASNGGVLYNNTTAAKSWNAKNCTFTTNLATLDGGVAYSKNCNWTVTGCTFEGNSAGRYGGVANIGTWIATGCAFTSNIATSGAVAYAGLWNAKNCTFTNNQARSTTGGGGVAYSGTWEVNGCTFEGNSSVYNGGVARFSKWNLKDSMFNNNSASNGSSGYGGVLSDVAAANTWIATNCAFTNNRAYSSGGVAYLAQMKAINCIFTSNEAQDPMGSAGGVGNTATMEAINCIFKNNKAVDGGVGQFGTWTVTNCAFYKNTASANGGVTGGDAAPKGGKWNATNCIFWANSAPAFNNMASGATLKYCDVQPNAYGLLTQTGCISSEPRFVSTADAAENFHLLSSSECVDAGTLEGAPGYDKDMIGRPLPYITGSMTGSKYDIGAYEYGGVPPLPPIILNTTTHIGYYNLYQALADASAGDTLSLSTGEYKAVNINWPGKNYIKLVGYGPGQTTLEGIGTSSIISIGNFYATIEGMTLMGGGGTQGGAINVVGGTVDVIGCVFTSNEAGSGGAGAAGSTMRLINCVFNRNTAKTGDGGALKGINNSTISVINCTMYGNKSTVGSGGGIFIEGGSTLKVLNSILWNNTPDQIAGTGAVTVNNSDIKGVIPGGWSGTGNITSEPRFVSTAESDFHLISASPCIDRGTPEGAPGYDIERKARPQPAGGICDMGAYEYGGPDIQWITNNKGGVYYNLDVALSEVTVDGSIISVPSNTSIYGTVINWPNVDNVTLQGAGITETVITGFGEDPIIYMPDVTGAVISGISFVGGGGAQATAIKCEGTQGTISDCFFIGGGVILYSCITFENTYWVGSGPRPADGGAVWGGPDARIWLVNCVIYGVTLEEPGYHGGAVYISAGGRVKVVNSILRSNTPDQISGEGTVSVEYSDIQGGWTGAGNIDADPQFMSIDPLSYDFHLQATSPCLDTGTTELAPAFDRSGVKRPMGLGVDMGIYEWSEYPEIAVYINEQKLINGDIISPSRVNSVRVRSTSAVNLTSAAMYIDGAPITGLMGYASSGMGLMTSEKEWSATFPSPSEGKHQFMFYVINTDLKATIITLEANVMGGSVQLVGVPLNYPNPFKPLSADPRMNSTMIQYTLTADTPVILVIFDITGHEVKRFVFSPGENGGRANVNNVVWNGRTLFNEVAGNGMYVYKLISRNRLLGTGKLVVKD